MSRPAAAPCSSSWKARPCPDSSPCVSTSGSIHHFSKHMDDKMQGGCGCGSGQGGCGGGMMWRRHRKPFMGLLFLAGVVYLILLSRNAYKSYAYIGRPTTQRDTISIQAEGKVTALPDIASVSIGVQTEKKTVSEA